jgi:hypothetical protein
VSDYELVFVPKQEAVARVGSSGKGWVIERARHWEIVRLS